MKVELPKVESNWESPKFSFLRLNRAKFEFTQWFIKINTTQYPIYPKTAIMVVFCLLLTKKVSQWENEYDLETQKNNDEYQHKKALENEHQKGYNKGIDHGILKEKNKITRNGAVNYDQLLVISEALDNKQQQEIKNKNQRMVDNITNNNLY